MRVRADLEACVTSYVATYGRLQPAEGSKDFNGDGTVSYSGALRMVREWVLGHGLPVAVPEIDDLTDFEFIADAMTKLWGE